MGVRLMVGQADTPRDLLFGLLALQTGLIDESALIAAFHAWTRAKGRSMGEILSDQGAIDPDQRSLLDGLATQHLKKHGGDTEKSLAAVNAGQATRQKLQAIGDLDLTGTLARVSASKPEPDDNATITCGIATADGQRFRLLRPHAQGGLGSVHVALDTDLNREVALKQILDHHADDDASRLRFVLEAEITGGLEHPGIVPVYGMGRHENGRPFYAMRFIRGDTLKDAIAGFHSAEGRAKRAGERSLELRKFLGRFVDVCDAIHYAHGRGVLHRDLKPSNIIIGRYGETLVVDWGLAKPMGHSEVGSTTDERTLMPSSSSGSADTLPGSALGTPAYMSPEQASGDLDRLGPKSDVYSLGATLYCLLTGKPPFEGQALGELLRDVKLGKFPKPRDVDSSIDQALEAICLKAMATIPADRYMSARALGEDIERWAADEPVFAFPEPARKRLARWQRKHPSAVYGGVSFLLVMIGGLVAISVAIEGQKQEVEKARKEAEYNAAVARNSFQMASDTVYDLTSMFADQEMIKIPGMQTIRRQANLRAVASFEGFLRASPQDMDLKRRSIRVFINAAVVHLGLGEFSEAKRLYSRAIEVIDEVLASPLAQDGDRAKKFQAQNGLARLYGDNGLDGDASALLLEVRTAVEAVLARSDPKSRSRTDYEIRHEAAVVPLKQGQMAAEAGDEARSRVDLELAADRFKQIIRDYPQSWYWNRLYLAQAQRDLARIALRAGDRTGADRLFGEALGQCRAVVAEHPGEEDPRLALASTLLWFARSSADDPSGPPRATDQAIEEAVTVIDQLARESTVRIEILADRAQCLLERGRRRAARGEDDLAVEDFAEVRRSLTPLVEKFKEDRVIAGLLGRSEVELARILLKKGRKDEARPMIESGLARLEAVRIKRPKNRFVGESLDLAREARRLAAE